MLQGMVRRFVTRWWLQKRQYDGSEFENLHNDDIINIENEVHNSFRWTVVLWSKLKAAISTWLTTFVIHKSNSAEEWHFRTIFVAEVTILPFVLLFGIVSFWLLNRNTHIRKTKGSTIQLKGDRGETRNKYLTDDGDDDDEEDDDVDVDEDEDDDGVSTQGGNDNNSALCQAAVSRLVSRKTLHNRKHMTSIRQAIHARLKAYDVEYDDDEMGLEESDCDDDERDQPVPLLKSSDAPVPTHSKTDDDTDFDDSKVFLSNEKIGLWKIVKEIPLFSYFNEDAMQICMEFVEYVDLELAGDSVWKRGGYDGSLYFVVNGGVHVQFHDFDVSAMDQRERQSDCCSSSTEQKSLRKEPATFTHVAGTVVTSLLASLEGMVHHHLQGMNSLGNSFVGAAMRETSAKAASDGTRLIRVPPACFCRVLDRFPDTVLRIIQTVLNRTQRVTVQTLVRTCGLREELLAPSSNCKLINDDLSPPWQSVKGILEKNLKLGSELETLSSECLRSLVKDACTILATILGISDSLTVEVLEEQCTLLVVDREDNQGGKVLQQAGTVHDACYLLLRGSLEMVCYDCSLCDASCLCQLTHICKILYDYDTQGIHVPMNGYSHKQLQKDPKAWRFQRFELITPGTIFGESACFTTDVNLFEVRCVYDVSPANESNSVVLLRIPTDTYTRLVVKHPQAMSLSLGSVLSVLSPVVHLLTWVSEWMHVAAAQEVVKRGTPCDSLFVVLNGRLRASSRSKARLRARGTPSSDVVPPEEFGRGKILGEIGSLAGSNWPYDVFAIRQSELAKVPVKILEVVVQNYPSAGLFLARAVASQVESRYHTRSGMPQDASESLHLRDFAPLSSIISNVATGHPALFLPKSLPSYGLSLATIAVVPLTYSLDMDQFCATLVRAMEAIAPCKLLTKSRLKKEIGQKVYQTRNALHDLKLTRMLGDMEENNRIVVYQADPKFTFWTRLCIQQADCILLVVDAHRAPERTRVEQTLAWAYESMDVRIDLVVVGEAKIEGENEPEYDDASYFDEDDIDVSDQLNNWSESRKWISGHHLVRAPFQRFSMDFRRMSRRITGRSVGLVLGGGGARGLAHLGVIRALKEAGVVVDMVGGKCRLSYLCVLLF
jgi:CRP-like cAMP-binding protein